MKIDEFTLTILTGNIKPDTLSVAGIQHYYDEIVKDDEGAPIDLLMTADLLVKLANILYKGILKSWHEITYLHHIFVSIIPPKMMKEMPLFIENHIIAHKSPISEYKSIIYYSLLSIHIPIRLSKSAQWSLPTKYILEGIQKNTPLYVKTQKELADLKTRYKELEGLVTANGCYKLMYKYLVHQKRN